MANAYMMRQDAKMFPLTIHQYAGDLEEALGASEWLYGATMFPETKNLIIQFLAAYAKEQDPDIVPDDVANTLIYVAKHAPYKTVSESFINSLRPQFKNINLPSLNLSALHTAVNDALNQEFARVRIGGMFNSSGSNRAIYFRISSSGFNWFNNIWGYVYDNQNQFDAVTVMKDPEATGIDNQFYIHSGKVIKDMPVEEFINLSGRPVLDSKPVTPKPLFTDCSTGALMKAHRMYVRELVDSKPIM